MMHADLIIPNLDATSKKQAFCTIAEKVEGILPIHPDTLLHALLERERIGSTGIGGGVAIPHIKQEGVEEPFCILARLDDAVDYDAIDNRPVDLIFLLLAPAESKTTQHLKMLAHISRFLKDRKICDSLRDAVDTAEIQAIMKGWSAQQVTG